MNHLHEYHDKTPISKAEFESAGLIFGFSNGLRNMFCRGEWKIWYSHMTNKISIWNSETNWADYFWIKDYNDLLELIEKHGINNSTYVNRFEVDINEQHF